MIAPIIISNLITISLFFFIYICKKLYDTYKQLNHLLEYKKEIIESIYITNEIKNIKGNLNNFVSLLFKVYLQYINQNGPPTPIENIFVENLNNDFFNKNENLFNKINPEINEEDKKDIKVDDIYEIHI